MQTYGAKAGADDDDEMMQSDSAYKSFSSGEELDKGYNEDYSMSEKVDDEDDEEYSGGSGGGDDDNYNRRQCKVSFINL